jgi:dienelactone hydrolase
MTSQAAPDTGPDATLIEALRDRTSANQSLSALTWPASPPAGFEGLACTRFEISSRGDRVPGHVIEADRDESAKRPLLLLQHGAGGDRNSPYLQVARRWVEAGAAVATIDFPLHGERRSPKLSQRLVESIGRGLRPADEGAVDALGLWRGFAQQAVADLRASLDHLLSAPRIDETRCAYASFSLGSIVGSLFLAVDARPKAAALALGGGGFGPPDLDPVRFIGALAPRPLLMLNARHDEVIPAAAAEALFAAAGEPREIEWSDTGHDHLPGVAMKRMWAHLSRALEL